MATNYTAHTLSVNDISRENIITGGKAIAIQIVRLILLEPGINSLYPTMGCGIRQLCAGKTENDIPAITDVINAQIQEFLPEFQSVGLSIGIDETNKALFIDITVDSTIYKYSTTETASGPIYLSSL